MSGDRCPSLYDLATGKIPLCRCDKPAGHESKEHYNAKHGARWHDYYSPGNSVRPDA